MFRKRLYLLMVASIVALAAVTGYAYLNFSGPQQAIALARSLVAQKRFAEAVTELDLAARGTTVRHDAKMREEVWRLRHQANAKLGNDAGALEDVENLLQSGHEGDETLLLERIRLTASVGEGDRALLLATNFLEQHPGDCRALELAGEACQTIYEQPVADLGKRIDHDLSSSQQPRAREALSAYLYCADGDELVATSIAALGTIYDSEPRLAALWQPLLLELRAQREAVQRALRYFQRSLEAGGKPVAAFRGFAVALEQSGRLDDLLIACEIYRRRYDNEFVDEAGATAVWALINQGMYSAAVATAARWVPAGSVQRRIDHGTVGPALFDLQLARIYAAWRSRDHQALGAAVGDNALLFRAGKNDPLPGHLGGGLQTYEAQNHKAAEPNLRIAIELGLWTKPRGRPDLLPEVMPLLLDSLRARNAPDAELQTLLTQWANHRPLDLQPRFSLAWFQLERNNTAAALLTIANAEKIDPDYDPTFELRLEAMRRHLRNSEQDGAALVVHCKQRGVSVPRVNDQISYVLCAEAALVQKEWWIAAECARQAVDTFPRARRPRLIEIEAYRAAGRLVEAKRLADRLLQVVEPDEETLLLALRVYREAGEVTGPLLFSALRSCRPTVELQAELLRSALRSAPQRAATFVATVPDAEAPELRILAASALAHGGRAAECGPIFDGLAAQAAELPPAQRADLAEALSAWLLATAKHENDADHARLSNRRLVQLHLDDPGAAPHLIGAATTLAETHPETALALVTHAMSIANAQTRNGAVYGLAGRLAVAIGSLRLAEDHWIAALAFEDGRFLAEDFARLSLALGRSDRAEQVYRFVEKPRDAALAARHGELEIAAYLAAADIVHDRADLLAHCTLAALGKPSLVDWQPGAEQLTRERLEVVSILGADGLGSLATARAQALVDQDPQSWANQMLLARALAAAGRFAEAAKVHGDLFARNVRGPVFWREVAVLGARPGYIPDPALLKALIDAGATGDIADSTTTLAYGLEQMALGLEKSGDLTSAGVVRFSRWQRVPRACKFSLADAELIAAKLPAREALPMLGLVLETIDREQRPPVLEITVKVAHELLGKSPEPLPEVYATVSAWADRYGPFGCIVHFLLDHAREYVALRPEDARRTQLLLGHLQLIATGRDLSWLDKTMTRLRSAQGTETTVADLEAVLHQHPSALILWQERAMALAQLHRANGIHDLRSVLAHASSPAANLAFATLAAAEHGLHPDDAQLIEALPATMKAGADAKFARALVSLRSGRPDEALALLEGAPPRADGLHLYATALALLQSRLEDGAERARTVLEALVRDYPKSSLARNAGTFESQLGPH
ncbi:MAG TPA: hypothetical protein VFD82_11190 [Planctomycetota bacterium]|nr:hypothetical protein [Planctomycetota bacterium]